MRRYLPFAIVAVIGSLTLGIGTMLYRARELPVLAISKNSTAAKTAGTESIHVRGAAKAPVTLEEFGDFQCPPCGKLAGPTKQLEESYGSQLRLIFRQFPLVAWHAHAQEAALASEAAGFQGRFWEMHDLLYTNQNSWSQSGDVTSMFAGYATPLGLNSTQ